jgi:dolichol-phosphate mannosyltransferase
MNHPNFLTALPVYNEVDTVDEVLSAVLEYSPEVLAVDDGSSDGTSARLDARSDVRVLRHGENKGYGSALISAFRYAIDHGFDYLVTIDCDGQHQPKRIPQFVEACRDVDIVSGSRYLETFDGDNAPPADRRAINVQITKEINECFGLSLTDTFCGFKAYKTSALAQLNITDTGYAMPLQLWVQAAMKKLSIVELPVPLLYLDLERSFGGALDQAQTRLKYYHEVIRASIAEMESHGYELPVPFEECSQC